MRNKFALLMTLPTLSACSSPYVYEKEIASFGSSVTTVSTAITQGLADIEQDQSAADLAIVVAGRTGINVSTNCSTPARAANDPCRLLPYGTQPVRLVAADFDEQKLRRDLGLLKAYAQGLAAVANAQDRKDYDAAAAQLASSVGALASSIPSGPTAAAGVVLPAVIKFTTFTIGESLDQARFDTLKSALNAVGTPAKGADRSPIQVVADDFVAKALKYITRARIELLFAQLNARKERINTDLARLSPSRISIERYDTPVTNLEALTATLNSVRSIDPSAVANSMVKAHNDLRDAVNDPNTQYATLLKSITDFADQAEGLAKAFASKSTPASKS
jgi:hypothetical protein